MKAVLRQRREQEGGRGGREGGREKERTCRGLVHQHEGCIQGGIKSRGVGVVDALGEEGEEGGEEGGRGGGILFDEGLGREGGREGRVESVMNR